MPLPKCVRVLEDDTQSREALEADGWRYVETLVEMKRGAECLRSTGTASGKISDLNGDELEAIIKIARENMGPNRFIEDGMIDLKVAQDVREKWIREWEKEIIIADNTPFDGRILGFLLRDGNKLSLVVVDENERRKGVGTELTKAFITQAWQDEFRTVYLGTQETNWPARAMYRRLGFKTYRARVTYHK